ncbi:GlxA family transcriptional regulator [Pseudomonas gingeri]|uniref:GlxA family transcriptional regulator n=1 Tax=Pseudomonas gingeri TaxID=117681 RepID=UPI0015A477E7|nr:helix-turn-helix domain-containing protein [Pseudomonas gingeri]NWE49844.1 helix-turn-helix domain-containing protein [Pseudomonas gingeri]
MTAHAAAEVSNRLRTILFLAYPEMGLLDLTGAQTVFWAATKAMAERGLPGYERPTASMTGGPIRTAEGLVVETQALSGFAGQAVDTVIVPGAPEILRALENSGELIEWIAAAAPTVRRTASVCSGAFLLAQAGLLETKRAVTHWAMCDMLKSRFSTIEVDQDAIFIQQGGVWTSAGVTAGIDLALALVEADCGRDVAMQVARELVVFMKRSGGQSQFSEMLQAQMQDGGAFAGFHEWLGRNLGRDDLSVEVLAGQAGMSARNFSRVYKQKTGRSPAKAVEIFRLEAARRLLEDSDRNIDQIASACGFGDEERMRMTFQRNLAVSPRDYRSRFSR